MNCSLVRPSKNLKLKFTPMSITPRLKTLALLLLLSAPRGMTGTKRHLNWKLSLDPAVKRLALYKTKPELWKAVQISGHTGGHATIS